MNNKFDKYYNEYLGLVEKSRLRWIAENGSRFCSCSLRVKGSYQENKEKISEIRRIRYFLNHEESKKEARRRYKIERQRNPEAFRIRNQKAIESGGRKARRTVAKMIAAGELVSLRDDFVVCVDCGVRATDYDHRDYNKPKEVQPVCRSCNGLRGRAKYVSEAVS